MPELEITIPLQPKQGELSNLIKHSPATWIGYGGSRGGAKSHGGRAALLLEALENPGTRWCILRRTYDLVRENHVEPLLNQYPYMRDWYRVGDKELLLPNKSVIAFRYAENRGDVEGMIGKEYRGTLVDQAEAFSERELNTIKSVTRWPGVDPTLCKLVLTFNPGNIGHAFLKRIFYDKQYHDKEHAEDYAFIQAFGWDNWEWARAPLAADGLTANDYYAWDSDKRYDYFINRTQYGRELNALPQAMRIGWLLGRMDQFAGQYYDIFSMDRHVNRCQPEEWHTRWLGIDWGFAHSSVCHWCSQIGPNKTAFYREFDTCPGKAAGDSIAERPRGLSPRALAQEIVERTPETERKQIKHIFLSHDAFSRVDERDTIADQMATVFRQYGMPYPEVGTKDVVGRAALLYTMMQKDEIVIDPACHKLIETIPMVCRDKDYPERPLKFEGDDAIDSAWYALTYRMREAPVPQQVRIMAEADKITDPVARWFYLRKHSQDRQDVVIQPKVVMPWEAGQ